MGLFNESLSTKMTSQRAKEIEDERVLFDGTIVHGLCHFFAGDAGAGKTTLLMHITKEILKANPDMKAVMYYIDGTLKMAKAQFDNIEEQGLSDRFNIDLDTKSEDIDTLFDQMIEDEEDLSDEILIYDTFKYATSDINNKSSNKKALAKFKELTKLGATVILLGHTNKDGQNHSGTAEIEQDTDALFRIRAFEEGTKKVSTIDEGGRCRIEARARTFQFDKNLPVVVQELEKSIDIQLRNQEMIVDAKSIVDVNAIKEYLKENPNGSIKDIINAKKEFDLTVTVGLNKLQELLHKYDGTHWTLTRDGKTCHIKLKEDGFNI